MMCRSAKVFLVSILLSAPIFAAAVSVNGTCIVGNCLAPDTLSTATNGTFPYPFNFVYTLDNGDQFQVQGVYSFEICGPQCFIAPGTQLSVTYLGNASGTGSRSDTLTVDLLLKFSNSAGVAGEQIFGGFQGPFAPSGTNASFQFVVAGQTLPLLGPFSPPSLFSTQPVSVSSVSGPRVEDGRFTAAFGSGSQPGATILFSFSPLPAAPVIAKAGVVPVGSTVAPIQPGEWVSLYGTNLAVGNGIWTGNFPTSLGGTSVTINGKAAYLSFVSPGQINVQAPSDTAFGTVPVVVTTVAGSSTSSVTLAQFAPSLFLLDGRHVAGIVLRPDSSGFFGGGTYDVIGPTGTSLGYRTVAAKPGDTIEIFGTGFGPTAPVVPAGQAISGVATSTYPVTFSINNVAVSPSFSGLSSAGVFQFNIVVPSGLGTGDVSLQATVGGVQSPAGIVISLQ